MITIFLVIIALAPGIAIAVYIYLRDKYEPEPIRLLMISFLYGGISLVLALGITLVINEFITIHERDLQEQVVHAFLMVALVEESCKFLFVRGILYRDKNFNEPFDGIVYSVMVGMGFATAENIIYVINFGGGAGILRMFTAIPAHALFAILMGYFLGRAKFVTSGSGFFSFMALLVATIVHGIYDYFLFISFIPGIWIVSFITLAVALLLARKAMVMHTEASPFKKTDKEEDTI